MMNIIRNIGNIYLGLFAAVFALLQTELVAEPNFDFPAAQLIAKEDIGYQQKGFATGPWTQSEGLPQLQVEGFGVSYVWRIPREGQSPLQIAAKLKDQLRAQGYDIGYECAAQSCGGFDFRYALDPTPPAAFYLDVTNYQYIFAQQNNADWAWVLTSANATAGYIQLVSFSSKDKGTVKSAVADALTAAIKLDPSLSITDQLRQEGHAVMSGLQFQSGSAVLSTQTNPVLDGLIAFLQQNPNARLAVVGHTDNQGSLAANMELSAQRAQAAKAYLVTKGGIDAARIEASGVAYLAPKASNETPAGRRANRRVEAVLLQPK